MKNTAIQNRKKSLVRTAIRLFKKEGFSKVSVEDIVKAGEISLATFYSYFPAKEEVVCIFRNSGLERCHAFYRKLCEEPRHQDLNALEKLQALLEQVMALLNKTGPELGRVFAQYRLKERNAQADDRPYLPLVAELIAQGQAEGLVREDYTAQQLADITDKMIMGAYVRWLLHQSETPMEVACAETVALHCRMLGRAGVGKREGRAFGDVWETALYMLIPDPRSGIKQMEEDWLERFYKQ